MSQSSQQEYDVVVGTQPPDKLVTLTHLIYALHAFALLTAAGTLLFGFVASVPSIVAVVLNYWKRGEVRGTWLESHFRWQIRTFWFAALWIVVAALLFITVVGILPAIALFAVAGLWVLYRVVRGWWTLTERRPLPVQP